MARYDTVLVQGLHRVLVTEKVEGVGGGYVTVPLTIYPDAEATVLRECVNGDVWVVFPELPLMSFVFKREELLYVNPPEADVVF